MKKFIKKSPVIVLMAAIMFAIFFAVSCTGTTENTDVIQTDTMTAPVVAEPPSVMPVDSLPPVDSSATSRTGGVKAVQ